MSEDHIVPDIIAPGMKIVFCGTALGARSAADRAYYAHPGNRFWKAMHQHGFTPHRVPPKDYATVAQWGLGLTDVCKTHSGNDDEIPHETYDAARLYKEIEKFQPAILAFTGKEAARVFLGLKGTGKIPYGFLHETVGKTKLFVLPSPSGHASKYWRDDLWEELASWFKRASASGRKARTGRRCPAQ